MRDHGRARRAGHDLRLLGFGILTSKVLRCRSFDDTDALDRAIYRFAHYWNRSLAHPFEWTYIGKLLTA